MAGRDLTWQYTSEFIFDFLGGGYSLLRRDRPSEKCLTVNGTIQEHVL